MQSCQSLFYVEYIKYGNYGVKCEIVPSSQAVLAVETNWLRIRWRGRAATAVIGALGVDLASGHLDSSDKAPDSRRRNEKGKVEGIGCRLRRRNDSSVNTICLACRHSRCS